MKHKVRRRILYYFLVIFRLILRVIPRKIALRIGEALGTLAFWLLRKDRHKTIQHLSWAFHEKWPLEKIRLVASRVFRTIGKTFADIITMQYRMDKIVKTITVENFQVIQDILDRYKSVIVVGGHFGNWELLAAYIALQYRDSGTYHGGVIGRRIRYDKYNQLLVTMRRSYGVETFYRDESVKPILKMLKKDGIIGVVPDQDVTSVKGVFVDFFNKEAYTPVGPAYLSLISGVPLVPSCMVWEHDRYRLKVGEPIYPLEERSENAVKRITAQWSLALEQFIRQYPEQWVWFHNRWKTRREDMKD